jgi:Restriction endonuclease
MQIPTPISKLVEIAKIINDPFRFFYSSFPEFTSLGFEHFCAFLLQKTGHEILQVNNKTEPDGGIDIISKKNNLIIVTQVKKSDWNPRKNQRDYICLETLQRHLGVVALRELEFKLKYGRQCDVVGYFMTLKNFSKPAITAFANEPRMKLFNIDELKKIIKEKDVLNSINNYKENYVSSEPKGVQDVKFTPTYSRPEYVYEKPQYEREYSEKDKQKIQPQERNIFLRLYDTNPILFLVAVLCFCVYFTIIASSPNSSQNQANASNTSFSNSSSKSVDYNFSQKEFLKTSSSSYSDIGVPFNSWIARSIQKTYTRPGDSVNVSSSSYSSSLFLSASSSLSSSFSRSSSTASSLSSSISSKDKIEKFVGKIGEQPIEISIDPVSTIKDKIIHKSGTIRYTKAANTPILVNYMEVKDVECEDGFSLCSSVIIKEKIENGGQIVQTTILNKQTREKTVGDWQWQSQDGDIIYDVIWDNEVNFDSDFSSKNSIVSSSLSNYNNFYSSLSLSPDYKIPDQNFGGTICKDGTRSFSSGRGTCSWHGGIR